jgi:hypothetical protein
MILPIILLISAIPRVIYIFFQAHPWWDASNYIGMGKYMFSGGTSGLWEPLRPLLWPAIMGFFWQIGLDPMFWGKMIAVLSALGTLYLVYTIGERIHKHVGAVSSILLSFTHSYFYFTNFSLTDIPSAFLSLLGAYFVLERKHFWAGVIIGLAFAMRFPQALFMVPLSIFVFVMYFEKTSLKESVVRIARPLLTFWSGFALILLPYLLINIKIYGDALLPIRLGREVIDFVTSEFHGPLYYAVELFAQNPFIIFAVAGLVVYFMNIRSWKEMRVLTLVMLCLSIVGGYFTYLKHKELRYSFAFLPYLMLLVGFGIVYLFSFIPHPRKILVPTAWGILIIISGIVLNHYHYVPRVPLEIIDAPQGYKEFYSSLPKGSRIITTSPQVVVYSDALVVDFFETWDNAYRLYEKNKDTLDYTVLDECRLVCEESTCAKNTALLRQELKANTTIVHDAVVNQCRLTIYKQKASE